MHAHTHTHNDTGSVELLKYCAYDTLTQLTACPHTKELFRFVYALLPYLSLHLSLSFAPPDRGVFINVYIICIHDWVLHIKHA